MTAMQHEPHRYSGDGWHYAGVITRTDRRAYLVKAYHHNGTEVTATASQRLARAWLREQWGVRPRYRKTGVGQWRAYVTVRRSWPQLPLGGT